MAISYSLTLASPVTADGVARQLHAFGRSSGVLDASSTPEDLLDGTTTSLGTWIRVTEAKVQPWHPVVSDLGFTPTVEITFRLDSDTDLSHQEDDMVRLVSGLFELVTGDAVLHRDFESIWLLRRGTELMLSERDDLWPPHRLAALTQPYRRATHTFAES